MLGGRDFSCGFLSPSLLLLVFMGWVCFVLSEIVMWVEYGSWCFYFSA